jgi:hypothetical protein
MLVMQSKHLNSEPVEIKNHKAKLKRGEALKENEMNEINWFVDGMKASASHILQLASEFKNLIKKK